MRGNAESHGEAKMREGGSKGFISLFSLAGKLRIVKPGRKASLASREGWNLGIPKPKRIPPLGGHSGARLENTTLIS